MLQAEALGVHLYVVPAKAHRYDGQRDAEQRHDGALAFLRDVWAACGTRLGMTEPVQRVGVGLEPHGGWAAYERGGAAGAGGRRAGGALAQGLLAARGRPGPGVWQAAIRREHDTLCLSVMLAPDPGEGLGWPELDALWSAVLRTATAHSAHPPGPPSHEPPPPGPSPHGPAPLGPGVDGPDPLGPGFLGSARLHLARLADPEPPRPVPLTTAPDAPLTAHVRARAPVPEGARPGWSCAGVVVPQGFAVWEVSAGGDARDERRLVVVAGHDRDPELTAWTWTTRERALPPLARYLLHAAVLRYQLRVWSATESIGRLRAGTDRAIADLLASTGAAHRGRGGRPSELLTAAHALVDLQTRERGLVDRESRSREMARTVEIAEANLTALAGDPDLGGPFADDRTLARWLAQRLDDEATYLETALRRCVQVGALADQVVQRDLQRRQETVNLGLTAAIGAIVMSLAAVQSFQYTVPLPGPVKPAAVTALGALDLVASLVVLRVVVPRRRWTLALLRLAVGALGAALAWVGVSAVGGAAVGAGWTWLGAGVGAVAGMGVVTAADRGIRVRRRGRGGGSGGRPRGTDDEEAAGES